jgi:hypothetical protein
MAEVAASTSINYKKDERLTLIRFSSVTSSSVAACYSDPDLLIREYFLALPERRAILRKTIVQYIKSVPSIMEILSRGASGKARNSYDGAVDLLAEIDDVEMLKNATYSAISKLYARTQESLSYRLFTESFLEILIKAIACAYKIEPRQRFNLIQQVFPTINGRIAEPTDRPISNLGEDRFMSTERYYPCSLHSLSKRMIQASIIDALVTIADDEYSEALEKEIEKLTLDSDEYISRYATEALQDIG